MSKSSESGTFEVALFTPTPDPDLTLGDFLLDRIAEDEDLLRQALDGGVARADGTLIWAPEVMETFAPRLLAECEAKRQIVELHKPVTDPAWPGQVFCDELETGVDSTYPCPTLRILAAVYADHPDYREEWKP